MLIVDDGSAIKPDITELRQRYVQLASVNLLCLNNNAGIEAALNAGLSQLLPQSQNSKPQPSTYIARLDCGDICHPDRFKLQKAFFDKHSDYGLVGSWVSFAEISSSQVAELSCGKDYEHNSAFVIRYPETDSAIRNYMLKNSAFAHPAVMLRAAALTKVGNYSSQYKGAEDYDLFFRILQVSKAANIPQVLTTCELTSTGISQSKRRQQIVSRIRLIWKNRDSSLGRVTFGIIRSLLLLAIPYSLVLHLKKKRSHKKINPNPKSPNINPKSQSPYPNPQFKIIHVVECASGGTLDVVVDLVNGMPEFQHQVVYGRRVDTPSDICERFSRATGLIVWKNVRRKIGFLDLAALIELIRIIRNNRPARIIHLHSSKAGFIGRVAAFLCGSSRKVIYTSHGAAFLCGALTPLKERWFSWLECFAAKLGGRVVACSESEAQEFRNRGINATHINNGVTQNQVGVVVKNAARMTVVTAGRIVGQKNPKLFSAIADAFEFDHRVRFVWVGDGDCRAALGDNVEITGWQTKQAVEQVLATADIYLSTSVWEGMPLCVLQAMQAGLPLVLSDCVGNRDLVVETENGYLFDDVKTAVVKLNCLISDNELRKSMGATSRKIVQEQYDIDKMLVSYRELYSVGCYSNK